MQAEIVRGTVAEINSSLPESFRIEMADSKNDASIHLHFIDRKEFSSTLKGYDLTPDIPNLVNGYFHVNWDRHRHLYRSVICIAKDLLEDEQQLRHVVLEETTQSLGLGNDSPRFPDSVFYESLSTGDWGTAVRLSERDLSLIHI